MTEKQKLNIQDVILKSYNYIIGIGKRADINLGQDAFKNNLEEIIKNPTSDYYNKTPLFNEIPDLEKRKTELSEEIKKLETKKEKIEEELDNEEDGLKKEKILLESSIKTLNEQKTSLDLEIKGDASVKKEDDECAYLGLIKYKEFLEKEIAELSSSVDKKVDEYNSKQDVLSKLKKDFFVVEKIADLKKEALGNLKWYYGYLIADLIIIFISLLLAFCYGEGVIKDIQSLQNRNSSDYFGMFVIKIPFAILIAAFVSGLFIFLNKLMIIIERVNNQLRNISQISVIASQIDQRTIDLIKNNLKEDRQEDAVNMQNEKTLFYDLITHYLIALSKNEMELEDRKNDKMKTLKELSDIIKGTIQVNDKK